MDHADIVEVAITRPEDIGFGRLDQGRLVTFALPDDAPVGHLRIANRQAIDGPTGAMVMRTTVGSVLVNMSANAEAQLSVLVQDLARATLLGGQVPGNEFLVEQRLRHEFADLLLAGRSGIRIESLADVGAQLLKGIGHSLSPSRLPRFASGL